MKNEVRGVVPKLLTKESFAPYGDVIEVSDKAQHFSINDGHTERYHNLAKVDVNDGSGHTLVNIFRSSPLALPISLKMMERHPLGSQAFIPMGSEPYIVVVAPAGELDVSIIEIFIANADQGVNYHKGTWHHFCLALNEISDFIVIDRGGEGENCDVETLDGSLVITQASLEQAQRLTFK